MLTVCVRKMGRHLNITTTKKVISDIRTEQHSCISEQTEISECFRLSWGWVYVCLLYTRLQEYMSTLACFFFFFFSSFFWNKKKCPVVFISALSFVSFLIFLCTFIFVFNFTNAKHLTYCSCHMAFLLSLQLYITTGTQQKKKMEKKNTVWV